MSLMEMDLLYLPNEVVNKILSYAGPDVAPYLLVNSQWYGYLCAQKELWANLEIHSKRPVLASQVINFLSKSKGRKISVTIRSPIYDAVRLLHYLAHQDLLEHLELDSKLPLTPFIASGTKFNHLTTVSIGSTLLDHDLAWCVETLLDLVDLTLIQTTKQLEGVTVCKAVARNLNSLRLIGYAKSPNLDANFLREVITQTTPQDIYLVNVIDQMSDVKVSLDLPTTKNFRFSSLYDLKESKLQSIVSPITSPLESLWLNWMSFDFEGVLQPQLPLKDLKIANSKLVNTDSLGTLLQHYGCTNTIETLQLTATDIGRILPFELEPCPNLWFLKLCDMPRDSLVEGHLLDWINHFLPNLRVLDIGQCEISMFTYIDLVQRGTKIIYHKNLIVDRHVLEWSQRRGVVLRQSSCERWEDCN